MLVGGALLSGSVCGVLTELVDGDVSEVMMII